jgi:Zn-dependent protease with chaperone function
MNFFESQDIARRNTGRLILLFSLAVISLVAITNLLVMVLFGLLSVNSVTAMEPAAGFGWQTFLLVSLAVISVVLFGSLYKLTVLAGGGARVAEMLGGRLLLIESTDFRERQLLNVVEEMALASGTPVPPVYLLEESGINAFAAGYSPGDAVIGITRGAINSLNRDELQGVIAHEFSHILHGDMRINIRLIAILHGILVLGIIGYHLMRTGSYSRRSKDSGGIVMLGLGLMIIGYVGTFFGNLIKAAVSRQREFLADASAVQFTRNPHGIAGALMRIATHDRRSYLDNPNSMEISHALFEEGTFSRLRRLYATHPPLEQRIAAILPDWNGVYDLAGNEAGELADAEQADSAARQSAGPRAQRLLTGMAGALLADSIVDQIGQPGVDQLTLVREILAEIPQTLLAAAHDPSSARALVYLMVIEGDAGTRETQLRFLEGSADQGIAAELEQLLTAHDSIPAQYRLSLLLIALHSLRQLSPAQYEKFSNNLDQLVKLDNRVSLFEWALLKIVANTLGPVFERTSPKPLGRKDISSCVPALEVLFSVLSYSDRSSSLDPAAAFERARQKLSRPGLTMREKREIDFTDLDLALDQLAQLKPLQKPAVLKACIACIMADDTAAPIELELLRAIGATLECPIPPLTLK